MASKYILEQLKERDVKAGLGYFDNIGEYVPYEKEKEGSGWDEESIYRPKGGTAAKAKARIDRQKSPKYKMAQKAMADAAKAGRKARDVGDIRAMARRGTGRGMPDEMERRQKAMRSEYFPQTGTRGDEEKGFFSGMYDKTVGEYQRGQDEKERLKEETKAAMAAEPDPMVKKEIARKGHAQYMKIAATEGQGERDRETAGGAALGAQRERDEQKYGRMAQHAQYRDREIRDRDGVGGLDALGTEAYGKEKEKDDRVKDYKGFLDESALNAQERARRGQSPITEQATGRLEDLGTEALPVVQAMERGEKRERLERQLQQDASTFQDADPELGLAGGRKDAPGLKEFGASVMQESIEGDIEKGMAQDEEERAVNEEFTQDQARDAISTLKPDEGDAVVDEIKAVKGQGPEWLEAKEALRDKDGRPRYVRYEGSGLVIDMSVLEKDIDRNFFFKNILPNTPVENRAALMASKNYFPEGDLSIAQKQSAKEIKELEILNLRANKLKLEAEKLGKEVPAGKKMQYDQIMTGFRQATKDKDWDSATLYADQLRGIGLPLENFDPVAMEAASNRRLLGKEPHMLKIAERHGIMVGGKPSLTPFYKQQEALTLKLTFLGKDAKATSAGLAESLEVKSGPHTGTKVTFGEILKREGIETWDQVSARITRGGDDQVSKNLAKAMGVEKLEDVSKEAYLHYAKQLAHDKISRTVWGDAYDEIKQGGKEGRATKEKAAQDNFRYPLLGEGETKKTKGGKEFLSFAGEHDVGREPVDAGLGKMAKERVVTDKAEKVAKTAAQKVAKVKKVKASKKEALKKELAGEIQLKGGSVKRLGTLENEEKLYAEAMKEGEKLLRRRYLTKTVSGSGRDSKVEEARFNSLEEAIKYFKDPKNAKELEDESPSFRHFISQK